MEGATPRFRAENLLPEWAAVEIGRCFEGFCAELLRHEYPRLHPFSSAGNDGAIDFCLEEDDGRRHVFECKHIGTDGGEAASRRFREVAKRLKTHLPGLLDGTSAEGQYRPWLDENRPIFRYTMVVDSRLENLNRRDTLEAEISGVFRDLAASRNELSHLAGITARVLDWDDLEKVLKQQRAVLFRYFKLPSLGGLAPLSTPGAQHSFYAFLDDAKLPYYRRSRHLALQLPPSGNFLDESGLLVQIDFTHLHGLVITGRGGVGKSRLTLELGREAENQGWVVRRARQEFRSETLRELARLAPAPTLVLILFDYLEMREDFVQLLEVAADLNLQGFAKIAFVGNCRTAFFDRQLAMDSGFLRVDLTPHGKDAGWFEDYRRATVRHILHHGQLEERFEVVCRELPMLAAFLFYLRERGKETELRELLIEQDFGPWVLRRVQASFGKKAIAEETLLRDLAFLFAALPLREGQLSQLGELGRLFERLVLDGWIEAVEEPEGMTWQAPHDVLADRLLLLHLGRIIRHEVAFFRPLLGWAAAQGIVGSVLACLQRNAENLPSGIRWFELLGPVIEGNSDAFRDSRVGLLRFSLLEPAEAVSLLMRFPFLFEGAELDLAFQGCLGWLARWGRKAGSTLEPELRQSLETWLIRTAPYAQLSNFLVAQGLGVAPHQLREVALLWIRQRPRVFATHFLLTAWLRSGFPWQEVQKEVKGWAEIFSTVSPASFIYKAWLDAGGPLELIRESCLLWLSAHAKEPSASFVYEAWLAADGPLEAIRENCLLWLSAQPEDPSAQFVYKAWLDAGGQLEAIRENCLLWLSAQPEDPSARFVYKAWLDAGGQLEAISGNCLLWLSAQPEDPSARFVYKAWLDAGGQLEAIRENCLLWLSVRPADPNASFVYKAWLDAGGQLEAIRENCLLWLSAQPKELGARFVYKAWLDAGGAVNAIEGFLRSWLEIHAASLEADFVFRAWLEAGGKFKAVGSQALAWLEMHRENPEAVYITKFVAREPTLPLRSIRDILFWCKKFSQEVDAVWRLNALGKHLHLPRLSLDVFATADAVLSVRLQARVMSGARAVSSLLNWLCEPGIFRDIESDTGVEDWLTAALRRRDVFLASQPSAFHEGPHLLVRVLNLLRQGKLDLEADGEALRGLCLWLDQFGFDWKLKLLPVLDFLKKHHPSAIWDLVTIPDSWPT